MSADRPTARLLLVAAGLGLGLWLGPRREAAAQAKPQYAVVYLPREAVIADRLLQDEINSQAAAGWVYVDTIYAWRTDLEPPRSDPKYLLFRK